MKKIFSIFFTFMILFVISGCTTEPKEYYQIPKSEIVSVSSDNENESVQEEKASEEQADKNEEFDESENEEETEIAVVGIFTQVGLYDHDAYLSLNPEYVPTIYLYSDNSFEFHYNIYEGMGTYKGTWMCREDEAIEEFTFYVENDPYLPNLDFSIIHNKARCDADFESAWDDHEAKFGMTSVEDILFHVDYWG